MSVEVQAGRRAGRAGGALNGSAALLLLLVLGIVAVRVNQTPPPTVAELQPQSRQQIKEAPQGQAPVSGPGSEELPTPSPVASPSPSPSSASGGPTGLPSPTAAAVARQYLCVGSPPRQTVDPQSPPCNNYYDPSRNNGGATAIGVTSSKIYVSWPYDGGFIEREADTLDLLGYFNLHFQLYGRQVELMEFDPNGSSDPAAMQADAIKAANGEGRSKTPHPTFASISYSPHGGAEHYYYDALAQKHVVSINDTPTATEETHYQEQAPYEWSTEPGLDYDERNLAQMVCNALKGRNAQYAGPALAGSQRIFGLEYIKQPDGTVPDLGPLVNALRACGAPLPVTEEASNPAQAIIDLQAQHVTSVMCVCDVVTLSQIMGAATGAGGYLPEWIVHNYGFQDVDGAGGGPNSRYPAEHQGHIIGLTFKNKTLPPDQSFWFAAIKEVDPAYSYADNGADIYDLYRYQDLMVLFSGLQLAGPNLTPQAFQDGMFRARFPDPGHGAAPYYQAQVGFAPGLHSFFNDAAPIWFNSQAQNYTTNEPRTGSYCFVDHGLRFGPGNWPASLTFYNNQPCR
ncbi:MAG: hypothetical protein ACYDGR_05800 [Candidatus Dormibacteria bacterium]